MKPSNYEINSDFATLAEIATITLTLTIPASFTATQVFETTAYYNAPNALFRFRIDGGDYNNPAIDSNAVIARPRSDNPSLNVLFPVFVYRKDATTIALCCRANTGQSVSGSSSNTLVAKVHLFETPFEA